MSLDYAERASRGKGAFADVMDIALAASNELRILNPKLATLVVDDLERPLIEHHAQQRTIMLAPTLPVAEEHQPAIAEATEELIDVVGRDREERRAFVSRALDHLIELALEHHAGADMRAGDAG